VRNQAGNASASVRRLSATAVAAVAMRAYDATPTWKVGGKSAGGSQSARSTIPTSAIEAPSAMSSTEADGLRNPGTQRTPFIGRTLRRAQRGAPQPSGAVASYSRLNGAGAEVVLMSVRPGS